MPADPIAMRILYVTGHYPPDLTSGATLQVQRLAHAAVAAGHEVRVLAGGYRRGLADGQVEDDVDEGTGGSVRVRWVGTTGVTDQDHDLNWWHPAAAAATADLLTEWPPDVVHAHALQTLGASVLDEAARRGVRTVVTMHDLWWWCARLFLVDRSLQPCSLVTSLGECECARNAEWRRERAARLLDVLSRVDLVLTPSAVLRDVVVANGLDPRRVRVDPNDVVTGPRPGPADRAALLAAPDVRFVYLGGPNPLKGADVVVAAARHLTGANGWRLTAHGLDRPAEALPDRVTFLPPFDPSERDAVLAAADVLVLPSVARESYSLAAREALAAGLAVVTSDCLGPEEVVTDGVNGLVVPTGDPLALALTMRRLVDDRDLLVRLRHGAASTVLPDLDASLHLAALLPAYAGRTHGTSSVPLPPPSTSGPTVLFVCGTTDPDTVRLRGHEAAEAVRHVGGRAEVVHATDPGLVALAVAHDVVVLVDVALDPMVAAAVSAARSAGRAVVHDADDLSAIDGRVAAVCDAVIAATDHGARALGDTFRVPAAAALDGAGVVAGVLADRARRVPRRPGPVRVGVLVRDTTDAAAWASIEPVVVATLVARGEAELHVLGAVPDSDLLGALGDRVVRSPAPAFLDRAAALADLDLLLVPLTPGDNPGNHHDVRCRRVWVEAALVGLPVLAADTLTLRAVATPGVDVLTVADPDGWREVLATTVGDELLRRRVGAQAERTVMLRLGPAVRGRRLLDGLAAIVAAPRADRPVPVIDGPVTHVAPVALAPYGAPPRPVERTTLLGRIRRRWR